MLLTTVLLVIGCQQNPPLQQSSDVNSAVKTPQTLVVTPRKSPNDTREYRYLTLPNQLRVLLVSDSATDKSAAALSVYRGSFHEPGVESPHRERSVAETLALLTSRY